MLIIKISYQISSKGGSHRFRFSIFPGIKLKNTPTYASWLAFHSGVLTMNNLPCVWTIWHLCTCIGNPSKLKHCYFVTVTRYWRINDICTYLSWHESILQVCKDRYIWEVRNEKLASQICQSLQTWQIDSYYDKYI